MQTQSLSLLSKGELLKNVKIERNSASVNYRDFFEPYIKKLISTAIGPYYWFITDNINMKMVDCSDDIHLFVPFTKAVWLYPIGAFERCAEIYHPEDRSFVYAGINYAMKYPQTYELAIMEKVKFNIYTRMINPSGHYKMALMQFPMQYFNANNENESSLVVTTDISHLPIQETAIMTVIDNLEKEPKYFKMEKDSEKMEILNLPRITKREYEILNLITKGHTSTKIASLLKIAYDTVENHKRNLREKTGTKTSAELISYVYEHNLL